MQRRIIKYKFFKWDWRYFIFIFYLAVAIFSNPNMQAKAKSSIEVSANEKLSILENFSNFIKYNILPVTLTAHDSGTLDTLTIGQAFPDELNEAEDVKYYKVGINAGQNLFVFLNKDVWYSSLYIKYGTLPTIFDYDDMHGPTSYDQAVSITNTEAGYYYIMVRSEHDEFGSYTLTAHDSGTLDTLTIGQAFPDELNEAKDVKYYKVGINAGQNLFVFLNKDVWYSSLYIKYGTLPIIFDYDDMHGPTSYDQAVSITDTEAGYYYIMVRSEHDEFGSYTLTAHDSGSPNQPPNMPSNPVPADNSTNISVTQILKWCGDDPDVGDIVSYDVYFEENIDPSFVSSNQKSTHYIPCELRHSSTYYWKIVSKDNHGAETAGQIWSFTTEEMKNVNLAYQYLYEVMDKYHNTFDVYSDQDAGGNHFYPSGWIGNGSFISFDSAYTLDCYTGTSCIKIIFTEYNNNQVEISWQESKGYDLSGATKIRFRAKGENSGEKVEFFAGGIKDESLERSSIDIILTDRWEIYTINLNSKNLTNVKCGFGFKINGTDNPNGAIFYLDDIKYDKYRPEEQRFLVSYKAISLDEPDKFLTNTCFTYDNALTLLSFLARGNNDDLRRAKILADAFIYAQNNDRDYSDGRLRNAYMSGDLRDHSTGKTRIPGWWNFDEGKWYEDEFNVSTHTGNLAWTMIALLTYFKKQGGNEYLNSAEILGGWIERETRDNRGDGGYTGGYYGFKSESQKIKWKATEHNIDIYVAFMLLYDITGDEKWKARAFYAKKFVETMWNGTEKHFWTGTLDDGITVRKSNIPLDIQAWAVIAINNNYSYALRWAEKNCYLEHDGFRGFDFNNDRDGIWFEGTAHMAVGYQVNEEQDKSDIYINEIRKAQAHAKNNNGKGIVAASHDGLTTGIDWKYYSRVHVGATSWYIFAEQKYNPYWGYPTISGYEDSNIDEISGSDIQYKKNKGSCFIKSL